MMTVVGLVLAALFVAWRLAKRRRAAVLAGRDGERPTYMTAPPARSVRVRKTESL